MRTDAKNTVSTQYFRQHHNGQALFFFFNLKRSFDNGHQIIIIDSSWAAKLQRENKTFQSLFSKLKILFNEIVGFGRKIVLPLYS